MRTELLNRCGIVLLAAGVLGLLVGLALRTAGPGSFALMAIWTLLPYGAMFAIHRYLGRQKVQAAMAVLSSLVVVAVGGWFTVDALLLNFSPISTGIAMYLAPIYQLPVALCTGVVCGFLERSSRTAPSNSAMQRTGQ
jgi:hypothetical protein